MLGAVVPYSVFIVTYQGVVVAVYSSRYAAEEHVRVAARFVSGSSVITERRLLDLFNIDNL